MKLLIGIYNNITPPGATIKCERYFIAYKINVSELENRINTLKIEMLLFSIHSGIYPKLLKEFPSQQIHNFFVLAHFVYTFNGHQKLHKFLVICVD